MPEQPHDGSLDLGHLDQWWRAHSQLDELVRRVNEFSQQGPLEALRGALDEFEDALDEHFMVEERVYFPLVERYAPAQCERVREARADHGTIRSHLNELQELMAVGKRQAGRRCLETLLECFRVHEVAETALVETLKTLVEDE